MINLSDSAKQCLDKYLQQVRAHLRGCKKVDADEVERNVIEHIESEFESATAAVSFEELYSVLQRLGSPSQWVPEDQIPWWRRTILRLRTGPEDWRLAYISFGLLIAGFILIPSFVVLLPASFIVARAALSETEDPGQLKAQKWLIYPSLIIVYSFVLFWLLTWPAFTLAIAAYELEHNIRSSYPQFTDDLRYWIMATSFIVAGFGLWLVILGGLFLKLWRFLHFLFKPFAGWFSRKWALILLLIGLGIMIVFSSFGLWYFL